MDQVRQKWLSLIFFLLIVASNWIYILSLAGQASIITHWVIVSPIVMTFFFVISLLTAGGFYFYKVWAFIFAYLIIIFSAAYAILSYYAIYRHLFEPLYLYLLLSMDLAVICYIIYYQVRCCPHRKLIDNILD